MTDIGARAPLCHAWHHRQNRLFPIKCGRGSGGKLHKHLFLDETSTNTKLTKRTGWAPRGKRYRTHAPFGTWKTQTFIAALRCHILTAPWIVDAPMNRQIFETYVDSQLAPTLSRGDVVIMDNVAFHKSKRVEEIIKKRGAWVLFLPLYSPDLNPIELAFSKLKALLRKMAARSFDAICDALSKFTPQMNAKITSKQRDMTEIKCDTLLDLLNWENGYFVSSFSQVDPP